MLRALLLCCCAIFTFSCEKSSDTISDANGLESDSLAADPPSEAMRRNMFGHHIPRGLTVSNDELPKDFVLFVKPNSGSVYLVNRDGLVIHEWKSRNSVMGGYLQSDGSVIVNANDPDNPVFYGGGSAGRLQRIAWDGRMLWDFEYATREYLHHHDFAVMPNGNILAIAWESKSREEAIQAGRKPEFVSIAGMWPERIVEFKPSGKYDAEVVWEWHLWDHIIQDHDPSKDNYGVIADHPERLDINAMARKVEAIHPDSIHIKAESLEASKARGDANRNAELGSESSDTYHFNAINYNPELDQIVVSSPSIGEILVIDHSTTTREASGHTGGKQGKGGDFIYRWGNPANYARGDSTDRMIFGQHDVRWIEKGKPGAGHITLFNNNVPNGPDSSSYSAVFEITPPIDGNGRYMIGESGQYGPQAPEWVYVAKDTVSFWSSFISGAHRTARGTTFINEGAKARFFEVDSSGEILWEYLNEYRGNTTKLNGDPVSPMPMTYMEFRATLIPANHPGLNSKQLTPLDPQPEKFKLPPPPPPVNEEETDKPDSTVALLR